MSRPLLRPVVAIVVVIVALLASGALIGAVGEAERSPSVTDNLPDGYDSTTVAELSQELPSGEGSVAIALFTADEGQLDQAFLGQLGQEYDAIQPSEDGTAVIAVIPV